MNVKISFLEQVYGMNFSHVCDPGLGHSTMLLEWSLLLSKQTDNFAPSGSLTLTIQGWKYKTLLASYIMPEAQCVEHAAFRRSDVFRASCEGFSSFEQMFLSKFI